MSLLGASEIRELAAKLELKPSKGLGQNFVIDGNVCQRIVRQVEIKAGDIALEIGPGLGSLSLAILESGAPLIAVEIDKRLADQLPETVALHDPDADLLVINKTDLAPYVGASLPIMESDAKKMRGDRPFIMGSVKSGLGLENIIDFIEVKGLLK